MEINRSLTGRALWIAGFLLCAVVGAVVWRASSADATRGRPARSPRDETALVAIDPDVEARIVACCSDCHAMPRAENFPREQWHEEVKRGYEFYARSGRTDLDPPPMSVTVSYFRSRAPEEVAFPEPEEADVELNTAFVEQKLAMPPDAGYIPEIAHLRWTRLDPDGDPLLLLCDMRFGYVAVADLRAPQPQPQVLAKLHNAVHVEPCDLDADGAIDLVVADLGSQRPNDHDWGRVVWLQRRKDANAFDEVVLASGLGRVADVRPADLDRDGDTDLVVAEFGHYKTGRIILMMNVSEAGQTPRFEQVELDARPGTIHVPVCDFTGDGNPDITALVSQECEAVDLFVGQGAGRFNKRSLWAAPDLTFGASGLELADLDRDEDMDILLTNGDAWDNTYVTPSHGVGWLENLGDLEFTYHRLTYMPGAYRALAGDIDLDGDMDVIAVAWLPPAVMPLSVQAGPLASIICLEQTQPGVFARHTLETGSPCYATLELADFDNDGDLDFAVGPGPHVANMQGFSHWLSVWWNQKLSPKE